MPKSTSKKKPQIKYHKVPNFRKSEQEHEHIHYVVTHGSSPGANPVISTSSSTVHTAISTDHSAAPNELENNAMMPSESENIPTDSNPSSDPAVDQDYLKYLASKAADELEKAAQKITGDESLREFVPQASMYLAEMIGVDGRAPFAREMCPGCNEFAAEYECVDCYCRDMMCAQCIVGAHSKLFLHRIQKWTGTFFEKTSLKQLGLRFQLGHPSGNKCFNPERCRKDEFTVLDISGIHVISLDFCGCGKTTQQHTVQLLRTRLFPSTVINPRTAATFRLLQYLELLSYESKLSVFEFYQTMSRSTDNTGLATLKDRYTTLMRMIHEWQYLKMMKRAGRGHSVTGIVGTKEGECAVLCPACPQVGKNMKHDWNKDGSAPFLHTMFVAIDANFRLKRKNVSNNVVDPGLNKGCAYFVEDTKYKLYLEGFKDEKEPKSSCSRHDAVNLSEKVSQGHAATGIGACVCARHDMKRPISISDLQRGERYCNMDYMFHSAMKDTKLSSYVVSYDIACQWSINLKECMSKYDSTFSLHNPNVSVRYLVPKFHLPAHIVKCREEYSFNYTEKTGRTDGEAPERGWVELDKTATSTREMGPGTRADTLDYHIGDENWKKVNSIGTSLHRKFVAAAKDMAEYMIEYNQMTSTLPKDTVDRWEEVISAWEHDKSQPNPYEVTSSGPTQAAVMKQLAEDEAEDIKNSRDMSLDDKVTPSVLISVGIGLEAEQRRLRDSEKRVWEHALDRQRTTQQYQLNTLQRKIDAWCSYQQLYIPGVAKLRASLNAQRTDTTETKPFDIALWLPSQIKGLLSVPDHLKCIEWKIRYSQAHEALDVIRTQLQVRSHLYQHKDRFVRGQGPNTKARNTISGIDKKIKAATEEYNAAFDALTSLAPHLFEFKWKDELLPLKPEDIRDLSEGRSTRKGKESEGKRSTSWIWRKVAVEDTQDGTFLTDRLRSEWCKAKARAERFQEEVSLLSEETMRVLRFFEWKAEDWEDKAILGNERGDASNPNVSGEVSMMDGSEDRPHRLLVRPELVEGHVAYAKQQAHLYRQLAQQCKDQWKDIPAHVNRMIAITNNPSLIKPGEFDKKPQQAKSKYNTS